ncbi:hypothetical protein PtB15_13B534 [Puccinia triticina]|nr:hypothetical protein PtB15_13B534 [Puccinia triticina]
MKVLRRSLHKEKDRISAGSPTRPDFSHPPPPSSNKHSSKQLPTQPFASLAAGSQNPTNPRSIGKPPTLVIKAITAYKSKRIVELSFQKGDFFHVVGERDDHEGSWFEASNPATGARGIVPKHCFELFGKKQNELPSTTPTATTFPPRSSAPGFQSSAIHQPSSPLLVRTPLSADPFRTNNPNSKTQPLYGIVRPLTHPSAGLIPVSFVEVQDVNTGKALAPNQVQDLIRSSVVPAVEEWKKATAAYKGNSIPLGKFDFAASSPPMPATNSHVSANPGSFNHPTSSRSTSTSHTRQQSSGVGYDHPSSARAPQHDSWHGAVLD